MVNTPLSFDFLDAMGDGDASQRMTIPQKITIPDIAGDNSDFHSGSAKSNPMENMASSMLIPDRIVVNDSVGTFSRADVDVARDFRDQVFCGNTMGGMITPPRTLTVDDTKSAHYPQTRITNRGTMASNDMKLKDDAAKYIDDQR